MAFFLCILLGLYAKTSTTTQLPKMSIWLHPNPNLVPFISSNQSIFHQQNWENLMDDWQIRIKSTKSVNELYRNITDMYFIITSEYPFDLNCFHEQSISLLYRIALHHFYSALGSVSDLSQRECITLMHNMIDTNIQMGINLDVHVWNTFFGVFYSLNNEFGDTAFCQLLKEMKRNGSNAQPNIDTFNVILNGIAANNGIVNAEKMAYLIIRNKTISHGIEPNRASFTILMSIFAKNQECIKATRLFLDHFATNNANNAYVDSMSYYYKLSFFAADINKFNAVFTDLLDHYSLHNNIQFVVKFMIKSVMRPYHIKPDKDTYLLLTYLSYRNTKIRHILRSIPPSDSSENPYDRIVFRLHQTAKGKNTTGYRNYISLIPKSMRDDKMPQTPDALRKLNKKPCAWRNQLRAWRRKLHQFDNLTTITELRK